MMEPKAYCTYQIRIYDGGIAELTAPDGTTKTFRGGVVIREERDLLRFGFPVVDTGKVTITLLSTAEAAKK